MYNLLYSKGIDSELLELLIFFQKTKRPTENKTGESIGLDEN